MKPDRVILVEALEKVRRSNPNGLLLPEEVVESARSPRSPLHDRFTWEDTEAAHQWRLHEARMLIRVLVVMEPHTQKDTRVFVSLRSDRDYGGGYRTLTSVLKSPAKRAMLLEDARRDMIAFKEKYSRLEELVEVFEAMDRQLTKRK